MTTDSDTPPTPARMLVFTGVSLTLIVTGLALMMSDVQPAGWIVLALGFVFLALAFVVRPSRARRR